MDSPALKQLRHCPAPAKLNLFLHVVGQRADGYHLLQSAFRLIDWHDELSFAQRQDGEILLAEHQPDVPMEQDLCVRAARLLKQRTGCILGATITLHKRLPLGGGLGGGSSDAATTLIALNRLWQTRLTRSELSTLGLELGADVPFFIQGNNALVEGIGERISPMVLPEATYVVIHPGVRVSTGEIFRARLLTRNTKPITMRAFAESETRNDLQPVACSMHPEVGEAIAWLNQFGRAKMTGSGACVFMSAESEEAAKEIVAACPSKWLARCAGGLLRHPLRDWVE